MENELGLVTSSSKSAVKPCGVRSAICTERYAAVGFLTSNEAHPPMRKVVEIRQTMRQAWHSRAVARFTGAPLSDFRPHDRALEHHVAFHDPLDLAVDPVVALPELLA